MKKWLAFLPSIFLVGTATATVAIAFLIALIPNVASAAPRTTIPEQFRGDWCGDGEYGPSFRTGGGPLFHRCTSGNFRIHADTYEGAGSNWYCKFTSIKFNALVNADAVFFHGHDRPAKVRVIFQLDEKDTLAFLEIEIRDD